MKKIAFTLIIAMLLIFSGCATGTYHPTKPRSEWGNDHRDCERKVRDIVREDPAMYDVEIDRDFAPNYRSGEQRMIKECMRRKGWTSKK